jgi:hypothetical protein
MLCWVSVARQPYPDMNARVCRARVKDLPVGKLVPHGMTVVGTDKSITLLAPNADCKKQWLKDINAQVDAVSSGEWHGAWVDVEGTEDQFKEGSGKPFTVYKIAVQTSPDNPPKRIIKRYVKSRREFSNYAG